MKYIWFKKNENSHAWEKAKELRIQVFCVEQEVDTSLEIDETDETAWHLLVEENDEVIGVGRIFVRKQKLYGLGRLAINIKHRGKGLSAPIIKEMIEKVKELNGEEILIHAQAYIQKMYEKNGFKVTTGEVFDEDGIDHIEMIYKIV
ncbi:GNAT family N-acetyltransferase [Spiroplasma alleghenense]|uniref:Acetyltransferase, GNAT family protein n=1 Tax=Spiroplasma alleghenense TaxID=216931 RepID=A0A345Z373_9MOLU|nr:GNAT family N-acetyltransferase [Spiroplasma alleghenense]AXK51052.1 acetyltransferase, GNAT family protein [Spiroplasma alleghenense]